MKSLPFARFIDLITFDQQIHTYEKHIQSYEKEINVHRKQIQDLTQQFDALREKVHASKKVVDEQEFEMQSLSDSEKDMQKKIDSAQNSREYVSLKKEIENIKKKQHEFEDGLLAAWNVFENLEKEYKQQELQFSARKAELESFIGDRQAHIDAERKKIEELNAQRPERIKDIPQEWLDKYAMMRSRISNPVVPVIDGVCSACFYKIPQQDIMALRKRKLIQCKDCYRFLYLESSQLEPESSGGQE